MDVSKEMETIRGKLANRHGYGSVGITQLLDVVADLTRVIDCLNKRIEELKGGNNGDSTRNFTVSNRG